MSSAPMNRILIKINHARLLKSAGKPLDPSILDEIKGAANNYMNTIKADIDAMRTDADRLLEALEELIGELMEGLIEELEDVQ